MAQYYPVLRQDDANTEEVTHFYQNIDENQTIQYVIAADSTQHQFQTQVVDSSDQLMILEGQQGQQVIIDQSQITYQPSSYIIQNSPVVEFPKTQQVYYMSNSGPCTQQIVVEQPIIQEQQPVVLNELRPNQLPKPIQPNLAQIQLGVQQKSVNQQPLIQPKNQPIRQDGLQKTIQMSAQKTQQGITSGGVSQSFQGNNANNKEAIAEDKLVALPNGTVVTFAQYKRILATQKQYNINERLNRAKNMNAKTRNTVCEATQSHVKETPNQFAARRVRSNNSQYLIQPPRPQVNKQPPTRRALPEFLHANQIQNIIDNTPKNEEFSDSIRMLVLLENGEQRLITFTLPKEACTIQEILEQVNVPFNQQTQIQVTESNTEGLNYIVAVGNVPGFAVDNEESEQPPQPVTCSQIEVSESETSSVHSSVHTAPSPDPPKEPPPKLIEGKLAVCDYCGYLSEDFNKCMRCKRKLPENAKAVAAASNIGKKVVRVNEKGIGFQKTNGVPRMNLLPKKKPPQKPKIMECETVVVSSDDEDAEAKTPVKSANETFLEKLSASVTLSPITKEPSTIDISKHAAQTVAGIRVFEKVPDNEVITTFVLCRTIRIGSYRFIAPEPLKIDSHSLTLKVPHPRIDNIIKVIKIDNINVVKMLVCFQKQLPVIFFYYTPNVGSMVRQALDMTPGSDLYFDPLSDTEEPFRRITILPEALSEESKLVLQKIYVKNPNLFDELTYKEANDILIKTCPKDVTKTMKFNVVTEIKSLLMYPPEGQGRITINTEDYMCLAQDQFLNDVIIDFYLKYLLVNLPEEKRNKVHIFSTFFYKRLTTKPIKATRKSQPAEVDPNLSPAQKRHTRVKNWTKNVNIFDKDFIIIPINENCHWFLAIICFPNMNGCQTMEGGQPIKIEPKQCSKKKATTTTPNLQSSQESKAKPVLCEDEIALSDKDEAEGDDSELDSDSDDTPTTLSVENNSSRPAIKQPCILIFDSLAGASRSRVVATLRDYLTCEYKAKLNAEKIFTKDVIKGACPKVPQQTNYTDCGLYLLQYVEHFFNDPIKDYYIPISHLKTWFDEITVTKKREDISLLIKSLMEESGRDLSHVPEILFPTLNGELTEKEDPFMDPDGDDDEEFLPANVIHKNIEMSENTVDSTIKPSSESVKLNHEFVEQTIPNTAILKPDVSEMRRKNTLAYLKAKRILRHKNLSLDEPNEKKAKPNTTL